MLLRSTHTPPRVAASEPDKPVPPEYGVTGMRRLWQTLSMSLTCWVLVGYTIREALCEGEASDQREPERAAHASWSWLTESDPTIAVNSARAVDRFSADVSCLIAGVNPSGRVEEALIVGFRCQSKWVVS
jgi:hypothetical protein